MYNQKVYNKQWRKEHEEQIKEYRKKYQIEYRKIPEKRERRNLLERQWRKLYPEKIKEQRKRYYAKYPWVKTWKTLNGRCRPKGVYGKINIKNLLTLKQLRFIWLRDRAYNLKKPSLHRVNPLDNYTLDNCEFIEHRENCQRITYRVIECCPQCDYKRMITEVRKERRHYATTNTEVQADNRPEQAGSRDTRQT